MTVIALNWETAHLYGEAWISHHRLRHRIFVERQQWAVPTFGTLEYDQFDTPAATYLLWLDEAGQARGIVRLIPTTQPYMVQALWPELINHVMPLSAHIWEATRFGCDHELEPRYRRRIVAELICACQEFAIANDIHQFLGVMPLAIFHHVIAKHGCPILLNDRSVQIGKHRVAAAYIEASMSVLATVRARTGLVDPVLSLSLPLRRKKPRIFRLGQRSADTLPPDATAA